MIDQIIIPRTHDLGGFEVRRALPTRERRMVGPFIFWDQMGPGEFLTGQGVDVRPHPHIGLSTLTYLFDGGLVHRDSLGINQSIAPGDVNLMTAGRGIVHSERTAPDVRLHPHQLFGIQSWLALPLDQEEGEPAFAHTKRDQLPVFDDEGVLMTLILGTYEGKTSPVSFPHPAFYADVYLKAGAKIELPMGLAEELALYPLRGSLKVGDSIYAPNQLLIVKGGAQNILEAQEDVHVMILGGAVMDAPRYIWWNFVSSSKERLEEAKQDWLAQRFARVPGEIEFIPLPD